MYFTHRNYNQDLKDGKRQPLLIKNDAAKKSFGSKKTPR